MVTKARMKLNSWLGLKLNPGGFYVDCGFSTNFREINRVRVHDEKDRVKDRGILVHLTKKLRA